MTTATATDKLMAATAGSKKLTGNTVVVFYGDHDKGSPDGMMIREGVERAEKTVRILRECGYRKVFRMAATSVAPDFFRS